MPSILINFSYDCGMYMSCSCKCNIHAQNELYCKLCNHKLKNSLIIYHRKSKKTHKRFVVLCDKISCCFARTIFLIFSASRCYFSKLFCQLTYQMVVVTVVKTLAESVLFFLLCWNTVPTCLITQNKAEWMKSFVNQYLGL